MASARRLLCICAMNALVLGAVLAPAFAERVKFCAREGDICFLKQRAVVRYGTRETYVERTASGRVQCSNVLFGDPAPNYPKVCLIVED